MKLGDEVYRQFGSSGRGNTLGVIWRVLPNGMFNVRWGGDPADVLLYEPYLPEDLVLASEINKEPEKASEPLTLTITLPEGVKLLESEYELNNEVYEVTIRKKVSGEQSIEELREECEELMSIDCSQREKIAKAQGQEFTCTCEDPLKWSRERCLRYLGGFNG